jgi:enoyl-CoA hydratase
VGEVRLEERGGGVVVATLSNPPHGLMDFGIVDGLEALVARAETDEALTGIVLTGAHPKRFVAHFDVGELLAAARASPSVGPGAARASLRAVGGLRRLPGGRSALGNTALAGLAEAERFGEIFQRLGRAGAFAVAALNGSAMGGGCELALACDARLMADGPFGIGQPEVLLAFPPGGGGTQRLARLLGSARALRICLDGGPLTPREAAEIGLVDEVVKPKDLLNRAVELATRMARRPKGALAAVKRSIYDGGSLPLGQGLRHERAQFLSAIGSPEAEDAMAAYVEATERTGELPLYDAEAIERALEAGRFKP